MEFKAALTASARKRKLAPMTPENGE